MADANRKGGGMGGRTTGHQTAGTAEPEKLDEDDLAEEMHGKNRLQGNDQADVHSERGRQAGAGDAGMQRRTGHS